MAEYKVPQDVEAEDKIVGFLSMKQLIFVFVAALLSLVAFQLAKSNALLITPFVPFIIIFAVLGLYNKKDQPVEVYLLAALGFYLKPHRRIWSQDGIMERVRITAPKKIISHYSDGLSKKQVKSNLNRLATLMDTRGWAAKNSIFQTNVVVPTSQVSDDRLLAPVQSLSTSTIDLNGADDMLDIASNPTAQKFDELVAKASQSIHQQAVSQLSSNDVSGAGGDSPLNTEGLNYNPYPAEMHQKVMQPISHQSYPQDNPPARSQTDNQSAQNNTDSAKQSTNVMTPPTPDAILDIANRRDDNLSVETIAKEAQRLQSLGDNDTVSLH